MTIEILEARIMGMFDYVLCNMPLPDGTPDLDWQTKSLECSMTWYAIRENGQLVDRRIRRELKPDAPPQPKITKFENLIKGPYAEWTKDWWEPKEGPDEPVNYTGEIKFYSMDKAKQWWEFCAFVENGKCFKIVQLEPKRVAPSPIEEAFAEMEGREDGETSALD